MMDGTGGTHAVRRSRPDGKARTAVQQVDRRSNVRTESSCTIRPLSLTVAR